MGVGKTEGYNMQNGLVHTYAYHFTTSLRILTGQKRQD